MKTVNRRNKALLFLLWAALKANDSSNLLIIKLYIIWFIWWIVKLSIYCWFYLHLAFAKSLNQQYIDITPTTITRPASEASCLVDLVVGVVTQLIIIYNSTTASTSVGWMVVELIWWAELALSTPTPRNVKLA